MRRAGRILVVTGLLFLASALSLILYNVWDARRASESTSELLREYEESDLIQNSADKEAGETPDYQLNPEMDMPEIELKGLNGAACIGILEIPVLDLKLPVLNTWSYPLLKKAPCRYSGSIYQKNLVIAAHNYRAHFGKLRILQSGDKVIFTDAAGNQFEYKVVVVEALSSKAVDDMTEGDWPLSLFTCTLDGKNRVTVRCEFCG